MLINLWKQIFEDCESNENKFRIIEKGYGLQRINLFSTELSLFQVINSEFVFLCVFLAVLLL